MFITLSKKTQRVLKRIWRKGREINIFGHNRGKLKKKLKITENVNYFQGKFCGI